MQSLNFLLGAIAMVIVMINAAPFFNGTIPCSNSTASIASHAAALPINIATTGSKIRRRSSAMCENCFSCKAKSVGFLTNALEYRIHIGAPYRDGWGRESIRQELKNDEAMPRINMVSWICKNDGHGMTKISFTAGEYYKGRAINDVFDRMYPQVTGAGFRFNCPDF